MIVWAELSGTVLAPERLVPATSSWPPFALAFSNHFLPNAQSLLELHKRRKALTEPEARYYLRQIVLGCQYLHRNQVIHRDLKLGNLFLNEDLEVKIGEVLRRVCVCVCAWCQYKRWQGEDSWKNGSQRQREDGKWRCSPLESPLV